MSKRILLFSLCVFLMASLYAYAPKHLDGVLIDNSHEGYSNLGKLLIGVHYISETNIVNSNELQSNLDRAKGNLNIIHKLKQEGIPKSTIKDFNRLTAELEHLVYILTPLPEDGSDLSDYTATQRKIGQLYELLNKNFDDNLIEKPKNQTWIF